MQLSLHHTVPAVSDPADPSPRVLDVAAMFGLGLDAGREIELIPPTLLTLRAGQVVFITGPSGGGKSTLPRLIRNAVPDALDLDTLPEPADVPLVDALADLELDAALRVLTLAGLGDAFVMLRRPGELSDGQRCRFRLAQAFAAAEREPRGGGRFPVLLADELGATLDRTTAATAATVARGARKWATRTGACFIAATTHDDLLEPLSPDVLIEKGLGRLVDMLEREKN